MRKVKVRMKDLEQVGAALERLRADNTRKIEECFEADRRFKELAEAGKIQEANDYITKEMARLALAAVNAGVHFEAAVVRAFGERRRPGETMEDYTARIAWESADFSRVLEMHRRNGLVFVP